MQQPAAVPAVVIRARTGNTSIKRLAAKHMEDVQQTIVVHSKGGKGGMSMTAAVSKVLN